MRFRRTWLLTGWLAGLGCAAAATPKATPGTSSPALCRTGILEGEVSEGQPYLQPIGAGLRLLLQPIASGWILRVVPAAFVAADLGRRDFHDYAELATPPYNAVTPLSISTDFAFRAQDAVGWNPRRFHFAASAESYSRLSQAYAAYSAGTSSSANPSPAAQSALAREVAQAPEGIFTIVDSRLAPGAADQWRVPASVSFHFTDTAHTLVLPGPGEATPLGKLLWLRFRVELELPPGLTAAKSVKIVPHVCGSR